MQNGCADVRMRGCVDVWMCGCGCIAGHASTMRRCMHTGVLSDTPFCVLETEQAWRDRAASALRQSQRADPVVVRAVMLCPFARTITDVSLALRTTTTRMVASTSNRILSSADRDAAALLGIDEGSVKGVPLTEDLTTGDYIMCLCTGLGERHGMLAYMLACMHACTINPCATRVQATRPRRSPASRCMAGRSWAEPSSCKARRSGARRGATFWTSTPIWRV